MLISLLNPYANFFGVVTTFLISICFTVTLAFGRVYFLNYSSPEFEPNTFLCENETVIEYNNLFNRTNPSSQKAFSYYSVSSLWYPLFSTIFIFIFGSILSFIYSFLESKISNLFKNKKHDDKELIEMKF